MHPTRYVVGAYGEILRIKERVEEKEGIPPAQQRLIFGGKQMYVRRTNRRADDKTVKDFGIEGGTVLHVRWSTHTQLVLSLRGGSAYV